MFGDDEKAGFRNQVVYVGDAARDGILHWDHGVARVALAHGGERVLKRGAGERLKIGKRLSGRDMRVRTRFALKRNTIVDN